MRRISVVRSRGRLAAVVVLAGAALASALLAGPARAAFQSCTFAGATGTLTATFGTEVSGRLDVGAAGEIQVDGDQCGPATLANTTTIVIVGDGAGEEVTIDATGPGGDFGDGLRFEVEFAGGADALYVAGALTSEIEAEGGAGDDRLNGGGGGDVLRGDDGDDILHGGAGRDVVIGSDGDDLVYGDADGDTLVGDPGSDLESGGEGDDIFQAYTVDGADTLLGGGGRDAVIYAPRTTPTQVLQDGLANDGQVIPGMSLEGDNVLGMEEILTGSGNDRLGSYGAAGRLEGGLGDRLLDRRLGGRRERPHQSP